jgi:ribosomal protein S18 acetylase RimI-like enzyme
MRIRPARRDDETTLRTLWDGSNSELDFLPYEQSVFSSELLTDSIALVAEEAGEIIGSVYAATPGVEHGFVFGLYVVPSSRRQGVARSLMAAVGKELRSRGRRFVVLSVDTPNAPARAMYEAMGFVDQARILRAEAGDLIRRLP